MIGDSAVPAGPAAVDASSLHRLGPGLRRGIRHLRFPDGFSHENSGFGSRRRILDGDLNLGGRKREACRRLRLWLTLSGYGRGDTALRRHVRDFQPRFRKRRPRLDVSLEFRGTCIGRRNRHAIAVHRHRSGPKPSLRKAEFAPRLLIDTPLDATHPPEISHPPVNEALRATPDLKHSDVNRLRAASEHRGSRH